MSNEISDDELTENIKILATDDEKIKSFGELFTNDSSREILQLLFNDELTATQISQKTDISLQLVKYHLNKLLNLKVVKISKIEKNSKSQDMKIYSATKFSIISPSKTFKKKTKESKLLVRSFRHIYKVAGLGIATGFSGLFSLSQLQQDKPTPVNNIVTSKQFSSIEESDKNLEMSKSLPVDESAENIAASDPMFAESEKSTLQNMNAVATMSDVDAGAFTGSDLFIPFIIITAILGGLTAYYLWKSLKKSKSK